MAATCFRASDGDTVVGGLVTFGSEAGTAVVTVPAGETVVVVGGGPVVVEPVDRSTTGRGRKGPDTS